MKLLTLAFAASALSLAQTPASPPKQPAQSTQRGTALPDAKTILERAAAATGGIDAKNSIKTQKLVGKMSVTGTGISGKMVLYRGPKGETYQIAEMPGAGKTEAGNNGDVAWERSTLTGPKIRGVASTPGDLLEPDSTDVSLVDRFSKIETAGLDTVNGKPCFVVHLWPNGRNVMQSACYDRETFLPVRVEMNARVPVKITLGDYRPVGPTKMPFLIQTETMGQTIRIEIEAITINDPLPPEATELPDEIEKLAYRAPPVEIREVEVDKDRPILRHQTKSETKTKQ